MYNPGVIYYDPKHRCCCNRMHVEKGAYLIAFVGAVFSAALAVVHFFTLNFVACAFCLFGLIVCLCIIWAQKKRDPGLYLPYLIVNAIGIVVGFMNLIFLIVMIVVLPEFYVHFIQDKYEKAYSHDKDQTQAVTQRLSMFLSDRRSFSQQ